MIIYQLTPLGEQVARSSRGDSTGMRILYFMRRRGGRATNEQIDGIPIVEGGDSIQRAIRKLSTKFITVIG